jgi:hypothetical protein
VHAAVLVERLHAGAHLAAELALLLADVVLVVKVAVLTEALLVRKALAALKIYINLGHLNLMGS